MLPQLPLEITPDRDAWKERKTLSRMASGVLGAIALIYVHWWHSSFMPPDIFWINVLLVLVGMWIHLQAEFRLLLQRSKFSMRLDEQGLTLRTYENPHQRTIQWNEMQAFSIEDLSEKRVWGNWATLWDANGAVLLQWPLFHYIDAKRFAEIHHYLHQRVNKSKSDDIERNHRARLWGGKNSTLLHPLSSGKEAAIQVKNRTLGYGISIILVGWLFASLNSGAGRFDTFAITVTAILLLLGVLLVVFGGSTLRVSATDIEINHYYERYGLKWDDVTSINTDMKRLIFESGDKYLVFTNPISWRATNRLDIYFWILNMAQQRGIPLKSTEASNTWDSSSSLRVAAPLSNILRHLWR